MSSGSEAARAAGLERQLAVAQRCLDEVTLEAQYLCAEQSLRQFAERLQLTALAWAMRRWAAASASRLLATLEAERDSLDGQLRQARADAEAKQSELEDELYLLMDRTEELEPAERRAAELQTELRELRTASSAREAEREREVADLRRAVEMAQAKEREDVQKLAEQQVARDRLERETDQLRADQRRAAANGQEEADEQLEEAQAELWLLKHRQGFRLIHSLTKQLELRAMHRAVCRLVQRSMEEALRSRVGQVNSVARHEISRLADQSRAHAKQQGVVLRKHQAVQLMRHTYTALRRVPLSLLLQRWSLTAQAATDITAIREHYQSKAERAVRKAVEARTPYMLSTAIGAVWASRHVTRLRRVVWSWANQCLAALTVERFKLERLKSRLEALQADHATVSTELTQAQQALTTTEGQVVGLTAHLRASAAKTHSISMQLSTAKKEMAAVRLYAAVIALELRRLWMHQLRLIGRWRYSSSRQQQHHHQKMIVPYTRAVEAARWRRKQALLWGLYLWRASLSRRLMSVQSHTSGQTKDQAMVDLAAEFTAQHQRAHEEYQRRESQLRADMEFEKGQALQKTQKIFQHCLEEVEQRARAAEDQLERMAAVGTAEGVKNQAQFEEELNAVRIKGAELLATRSEAMNEMLLEKDRQLQTKTRQLKKAVGELEEHVKAKQLYESELARWKAHCEEMSQSCDQLESRKRAVESRLHLRNGQLKAGRLLCYWRGLAASWRQWRWRFQTTRAKLALELSTAHHKYALRQAYVVCSMYYVGALRIALVLWQQVVMEQFTIDKHNGNLAQEKASLRDELKTAQNAKQRAERQLSRISSARLHGKSPTQNVNCTHKNPGLSRANKAHARGRPNTKPGTGKGQVVWAKQVSRWWPARVVSGELEPASAGCVWVVWLGSGNRSKIQLKNDCIHPFLEHFNQHFNADLDNNSYKRAVREGLDAMQSTSTCQSNPIFDEVKSPTKGYSEYQPKSATRAVFDKENIENFL